MTAGTQKLKVGISSCVIGEKLRHDGGHQYNVLRTGLLARWFDYVPTYPELGTGKTVPVTMLPDYFHLYPDPCIARETFLPPYPDELRLRNIL